MFFSWNKTKMTAALFAALCMAGTSFGAQRSSSSRLGVSDYKVTPGSISSVGDNAAEVVVEFITNGTADSIAIDLAFILDKSGSMNGQKMIDAKDAADSVISRMSFDSDDRGAVVSFDGGGYVIEGYTSNEADLHSAVASLVPDGASTNLEAGIDAALSLTSTGGRKENFIFLSDGSGSLDNAHHEAAAQGIKIFTVGVGNGADTLKLKEIASVTGGEFFFVPISSKLDSILNLMYDIINKNVVTNVEYTADFGEHFGNLSAIYPDAAKWSATADGAIANVGSFEAGVLRRIRFNLSELLPDQLEDGYYNVVDAGLVSYKDRDGAIRTIELDSLAVFVDGDSIIIPDTSVTLKAGNAGTYDGYAQITSQFRLYNDDAANPIPLNELKVRYYYSSDVTPSNDEVNIEWCGNWQNNLPEITTPQVGATVVANPGTADGDHYVEVRFGSEAGELVDSTQVNFMLQRPEGDYTPFTNGNDHSFTDETGADTFIPWEKITVYRNGQLIWGVEPN